MSKDDSGKEIDADILQCKADILRSRDIMPPYKGKPHSKPQSSKTAEKEKGPDAGTNSVPAGPARPEKMAPPLKEKITADTVKIPEFEQAVSDGSDVPEAEAKQVKPGEDILTNIRESELEKPQIPTFDLAEEIMAEQRKITAIRRKAPDRRVEAGKPQAKPAVCISEQASPGTLEQDQLIAEIVARDIARLCRGGTSELKGQNFRDTK